MPKINRFWSQVSTGLTLVACLVVAFGVDAQESQWLTVAAVSCEIKIRDTTHNLKRIDDWSRQAAMQGADLVLFPECTIHGWWQSRENRLIAALITLLSQPA